MSAKRKPVRRAIPEPVVEQEEWIDPNALRSFASSIIKDLLLDRTATATAIGRDMVAENSAAFAQSIVARISL